MLVKVLKRSLRVAGGGCHCLSRFPATKLRHTAVMPFWQWLTAAAFLQVVAADLRRGATDPKDAQVPSATFKKITHMIEDTIARQKEKLLEDSNQADLCKKEQKKNKENLESQSDVVKKAIEALEEAKKKDKEYLEMRLKTAKDRAKAAAADREVAEAKFKEFEKENPSEALRVKMQKATAAKQKMTNLRTDGPPKEEKPLRKTQEDVIETKHNLKQEMARLKNFEKEHELLHDKCFNGPLNDQAAEDRFENRLKEIENLKTAYNILDTPDWKKPA